MRLNLFLNVARRTCREGCCNGNTRHDGGTNETPRARTRYLTHLCQKTSLVLLSDHADFDFFFLLNFVRFFCMGPSCSMGDTNTDDNSTTLAPGDKILPHETPVNGHSNGCDHNHPRMRPFIDPGLVIQRTATTGQSWLSDFVSPKSAPEGAYSFVSQVVKKIMPERTACRLGKPMDSME